MLWRARARTHTHTHETIGESLNNCKIIEMQLINIFGSSNLLVLNVKKCSVIALQWTSAMSDFSNKYRQTTSTIAGSGGGVGMKKKS